MGASGLLRAEGLGDIGQLEVTLVRKLRTMYPVYFGLSNISRAQYRDQ
ncbi:MAG: hypothetical protein M3454_12790 [Actinomycetota bacterium]|nr:hypothetical protein [Actinomycetota bacterium]